MPILSNMVASAQQKRRLVVTLLLSTLYLNGCAALQPPGPTGPAAAGSLYPILLMEDSQRKEATVIALNRLAQLSENMSETPPQLQPITGTILTLPPKAASSLYLPKLGAGAVMSEEETRESLRRFIREWQQLIGSDPAKLSLVDRIDQPDGSKLAIYEQRPFRYPIRGGYGKLQIIFGADRRVISLTSTCIPDAERIQNALSALNLRPKAEDAVQQLHDKGVTFSDANGTRTFSLPPSSQINPRGLTTYVRPAKTRTDALEFHLAWEMELNNAPVKLVYVDAVNGEIVGVE
ncbi:MAG TPA: hypothetical protein VGW76_08140 [Pyrinomonadaceae bacterium]|nr:hypothetical protein [Pyrinomonadaceae bacterium]